MLNFALIAVRSTKKKKRNASLHKHLRLLLGGFFVGVFLASCNTQPQKDQSASEIYQKLVSASVYTNLDLADDYYTSLRGEHFHSVLLPEASLIMAMAHIKKENYSLASFYLDEYSKRFAQEDNAEFIEFLKIKAAFLALREKNRNQTMLIKGVQDAKTYTNTHKNSAFYYYASDIYSKLSLGEYFFNQEVSKLYTKQGEKKAAKIYADKNAPFPLENLKIHQAKTSWIRSIFE